MAVGVYEALAERNGLMIASSEVEICEDNF